MKVVFRFTLVVLALALLQRIAIAQDGGLIHRDSRFGLADTVARIEAAARSRGLTVFARIDHADEARKVGQQLPPTILLILGNARGGTPIMRSVPASAIDLPMKVLVRQGPGGSTLVTINDPSWLQARHGLPDDVVKPLMGLSAMLTEVLY
jgi:uncharacterized protein (DUF302 family)